MKLKMAAALFILPTMVLAHEKFPAQCRVSGVKYTRHNVVLFSQHTALPRLYVIQNVGKHSLWLNHQGRVGTANAGWASQLSPNRWSAILVTKRNFDLSCQTTAGMKTISCHDVLHVCQFSQFYSKNPMSGGYWVTENVPYRTLASHIRARGFSLPVHDSK